MPDFFSSRRASCSALRTHAGWMLLALLLGGTSGCNVPLKEDRLAWRYAYDQAGRTSEIRDPAGRVTRFTYELGPSREPRKVVVSLPDASTAIYELNDYGLLRSSKNQATLNRYQYDSFGRLSVAHKGTLPAIEYTRDTKGRVTRLSTGGWIVTYRYDYLGRIVEIGTPAGVVRYDYSSGQGMVIRTLPGGVQSIYQQRPSGDLESLVHSGADHRILARFKYSYRPDGLLAAVEELTSDGEGKTQYLYDSMHRLILAEDSRSGTYRYRYDLVGNRVAAELPGKPAAASVYDWAGRLTAHQGSVASSDAVGNLLAYKQPEGAVHYDFTTASQLRTVTLPQEKVSYEYDAEGQFAARVSGKRRLEFASDATVSALRPLLSRDEHGRQTLYVWDGAQLLLTIEAQSGARFYLHDRMGSIRGTVNSRGKLSEERRYLPFGEPTASQSGLAPGFAGMLYDGEAGLYLSGQRAYAPVLGRFLQRDPAVRVPGSDAESLSVYAYCASDPVNFVDEDGAAKKDLSERIATDHMIPVQFGETTYNVHYKYQPKDYYATPSAAGGRLGLWGNERTQKQAAAADEHYKGYVSMREFYVPGKNSGSTAQSSRLDRVYLRGNDIVIWNQYTPHRSYDEKSDRRLLDLREFRQDIKAHDNLGAGLPGFVGRVLERAARERSPVGGVALAGAGKLLSHLGMLRGVAVDDNGRMLLLAADGSSVQLPPLPLDALVTVFRSVYVAGEAPTVSIDPDPKAADPGSSPLLIRHGPATANTYVGWVLFEADRIMKSYGQGRDNETARPIQVTLPNYDTVLSAQFVDNTGYRGADGHLWGRFWIVPERVTRTQTAGRALTLLDVGLRVNAETEIFEAGTLRPAPDATPSASAKQFADWFTAHYEDLEHTVVSPLPRGHGMPFNEVHVFAELRRIALLTAIAETLRDQGRPMPTWMDDYQVTPFPVPTHTRPLSTTRQFAVTGGQMTATLRGGVNLSASGTALQEQPAAPAAQELAPKITAALDSSAVAEAGKVAHDSSPYSVVALPGTASLTIGAARLQEADLELRAGAFQLAMRRSYNSLFAPRGELGTGWSLDLPHLETRLMSSGFDGKTLTQQRVYQLRSPLSTYTADFSHVAPVAELGGEFLVPSTAGSALALGFRADHQALVILRSGEQLLFDQSGYLIERTVGAFAEHYQRDATHRVSAIAGQYGNQSLLRIDLYYDRQGRLASAAASDGQRVRYSYDAHGHLAIVRTPKAEQRYAWTANRLTESADDSQGVVQYRFAADGRLVEARRRGPAGEVDVGYTIRPEAGGIRFEISRSDEPGGNERITYDAAMRPLRHQTPTGEIITWRYPADGSIYAEIATATGQRFVYERGAKSTTALLRTPTGGTYRIEYDSAGREITVWQAQDLLQKRTLLPTGQLAEVQTADSLLQNGFGPDGTLKQTLLTSPESTSKGHDRWQLRTYDTSGRTESIKDESGEEVWISYHESGEPTRIATKRAEIRYERNAQGMPLREETSWGLRVRRQYSASGALLWQERKQDGAVELAKYDRGLLTYKKQFDGGEFSARYSEDSSRNRRPSEQRLPGGVRLRYHYKDRHLSTVSIEHALHVTYQTNQMGQLQEIVWQPAS